MVPRYRGTMTPSMSKIEKAFHWITNILEEKKIPFQISGGFAAHLYGATRPIADLDFDVPEKMFSLLLPEVKEFVTYGPMLHVSESWRVYVMTLEYEGQEIDIGGAYEAQLFNTLTQEWEQFPIHLDTAEVRKVFGKKVLVCNKQELITYKQKLGREVDKQDVAELAS
jgi:hypothetical protein